MLGMGFSDKPVAYEYSVPDHADMHEALLAHLGVESAHILAHDLGDSVGQELLARHEFGEQSYGALRIESITWLNGGLFNEAYTPRLMQKLMSRTPLGDIMSPLQGSPLSRRLIEPTINEMFGPDTKPSRRMLDLFHQILEYNDGKRVTAQGRAGSSTTATPTAIGGCGRCGRPTVPMRLIDGPVDPNSGRHMAQRYLEVIPNPDVVMLDDEIGHWPQIEAPDAVLAALPGARRPRHERGGSRSSAAASTGTTSSRCHGRACASRRKSLDRGFGVVGRLPVPAQPAHHLGGEQVLRRAPKPVLTVRRDRRGRLPAARRPRACGGPTATRAADRSAVRRSPAGRRCRGRGPARPARPARCGAAWIRRTPAAR